MKPLETLGKMEAIGETGIRNRCVDSWTDRTFRSKLFYTFCYLAAFNAVGCVVGLLGSTLLDLQLISGTNVEQASKLFTAQSAGHMTGTLFSGILYDRFNSNLILLIALPCCALGTVTAPWCSIFGLMLAVFALRGLTMGLIDTGSNAGTVGIWGKDSGPYMQALHFSFAIGAMLSPLLATPFLSVSSSGESYSGERLDISVNNATAYTGGHGTNSGTEYNLSLALNDTREEFTHSPTRIHYVYLIVGIWISLTSLPFMFRFCRNRHIWISQKKLNTESHETPLSFPFKIISLGLLSAFFMIYAGTFDCFSGFLMTFVVQELGWTKPTGLLLTSAYWAAFAASRGLAVPVARFLTPDKMIFANYIIMTSALLGILLASAQSSVAMWICTLLTGLAMSSTFPAAFTWAERELFKVSGKFSAFLILSASTGTIILPVLLGYLFQEHSKLWYVYLVLGGGVICSCLFLVLVIMARYKMTNSEVRHDLIAIQFDHDSSKTEKLLNPVEKS